MSVWNNAPPEARSRRTNWPTLLFSWWCTAFAAVIILTRLAGRKIRTGRLFQEDKVMGLSLIPLLARMGLVHIILLYGTNNVQTEGLTEYQIHHRSIGSRLVLASRIMYALFIWMSKFTVSEFLKRLTSNIWRRSYEIVLHSIRIFLVVTFVAVVIATLSECQPFDHYWQVVPDPGPQCRQGYAQLLTMGTADIITDVLLVCFPIPIVLRSQMPFKRKLSLVCLFSFSVALIVITGMRMPHVISHHGRQQYRTVWASGEILASAAVSNAVILGSFVRDKGVKKNKYRRGSAMDSIERASTRRHTIESYHRDSEEALFREMGCRMPKDLCNPHSPIPRPAPTALPATNFHTPTYRESALMSHLDLGDNPPSPHDSADALRKTSSTPPSTASGQSVSFFDVGGLLGSNDPRRPSNGTTYHDFAIQRPTRQRSQDILSELGGRLSMTRARSTHRRFSGNRDSSRSRPRQSRDGATRPRQSRDELPQTPTSRAPPEPNASDAMDLQDIGGLLASTRRPESELQSHTTSPPPQQQQQQRSSAPPDAAMDLQDVGGLLR